LSTCWWRCDKVSKALSLLRWASQCCCPCDGLGPRLLDDLALHADGVVELVDEGAVVAPGVGAEAVACGLHEAFVVLLAVLLEHAQLLLEIALGSHEFAELARRFVGTGLGEIKQGLKVKARGHRMWISRNGE